MYILTKFCYVVSSEIGYVEHSNLSMSFLIMCYCRRSSVSFYTNNWVLVVENNMHYISHFIFERKFFSY